MSERYNDTSGVTEWDDELEAVKYDRDLLRQKCQQLERDLKQCCTERNQYRAERNAHIDIRVDLEAEVERLRGLVGSLLLIAAEFDAVQGRSPALIAWLEAARAALEQEGDDVSN